MTQKQWKMISTIISIIIVVVFALYKAFGEQKATNKSNTHSSSKTSQNASNSSFTGKNFDYFESMKKYPFKYVYGVDGDTFHLSYEGKEFKVRLLIIDAPETAKEGKEAQPFADEAKKRTEELLKNAKKIEGSFDVGDHADKYDRALMYVYVDGKLLQDILIEEGLARVGYAYEPNTSLLKQFQEIEKKAKKRKKNIWEKDGYVTNKGYDTSVYK